MPGDAAPSFDTPPDLILVEAEGLMAARFDREALELLGRIEPDAQESTRAFLLTAVAFWNLGRFEDASTAMSGILDLEPTDPDVVRTATWMRMAVLHSDDARMAAREWSGLTAGDGAADPWAAMALARIRVARGLANQAAFDDAHQGVWEIREAAAAVAEYSAAGSALLRGHAGLLEGHWEQAATDYAAAIHEAPDHAQAHADRAFALSQINRHDEAMREAFDAVRTAPHAPWVLAVLRRTIDHARALPRRLAVALTLFGALLAGQPPGTPAFIVGAVATIAAIMAIGWQVGQIWRTPKDIRDAYGRTEGRTYPLVGHAFQGVLVAFAALVFIFGGIELAKDFSDDPVRTIVAFGGIAFTGYAAADFERKRRRQVPVAWVDLSYPWHRPTYPAVVPAEG